MLKYLIFALLLFAEVGWAAGFELHISDVGLETADINYRRKPRIAMDAQGDVFIAFIKDSPDEDLCAAYIESWGSSYTYMNQIVPRTVVSSRLHPTVVTVDDTIFFAADPVDNDGDASFGFYDGGTVTDDTVGIDAEYGNWDGRPMPAKVGDLYLSWHVKDDGTDSSFLFIARSGLPVSGSWEEKLGIQNKYGDGWSLPVSNSGTPWGFLFYDNAIANDLFLVDTFGVTTLSANFFTSSTISASEQGMEGFCVIDSDGVAIQQASVSAGADSIYVFTFRVTDMTGSAGLTYLGDTTVILAAASNPDGTENYPTLQWLYGTDTVIAYYRYIANGANADSVDIAYKVSADRGATWGSQNIFRAAVDGDPCWNLNIPQVLYKDGSGNVISYAAYTLNEANSSDSLYIYADTIAYASTDEGGNTQIIIMGEADEKDFFDSPICTAAMRFWLR